MTGRARMPWWEVSLPCEGPGGGRWSQLSRWVQAPDGASACEVAERLLPPTYSLDDQATAVRIDDPHTIAAHEKRLADEVADAALWRAKLAANPGNANATLLLEHSTARIARLVHDLAERIELDAEGSRSLRRYRWRQRHGHEMASRQPRRTPVTAPA